MIYNAPVICHKCQETPRWFLFNVAPEYGYLKCKCQEHPVVYSIPVMIDLPFKDYLVRLIRERKFINALSILLTFSSTRDTPSLIGRIARKLGLHSVVDKEIDTVVRSHTTKFATELSLLCSQRQVSNFMYRYSSSSLISPVALFSLINQGPVLDIGCGTGHAARAICRKVDSGEVIGVDNRFHYLYLAKKFIAPDADFICADGGDKLPFKSGHFQFTVLSGAFNFIRDKTSLVSEINRVTRGQGMVLNTWVDLTQNYIGYPPPTLEECRKLFPDGKIFGARKITREFVQSKGIDLTSDVGDDRPEIVTIIKAPPEFFRRYNFSNWPFTFEDLMRINPVYDATVSGDSTILKRKELPEEAMERLLIDLGCFPEQIELTKAELEQPSDDLKFKFVFVDLPRDYI